MLHVKPTKNVTKLFHMNYRHMYHNDEVSLSCRQMDLKQ